MKERLSKAWAIIIGVGALGGFLGISEKLYSFFITETRPEVRALNLAPDPFLLPFVIKNPSLFFSMHETTWTCGIDHVGNSQTGIANLGIIYGRPTDISP